MADKSGLNFKFDLKQISEDGTFSGYGAVFGNVDYGSDQVLPGAFNESLAMSAADGVPVKMLWQHDHGQPIGVWDDIHEDEKGLFCKGRLLLDLSRAREAYVLLKNSAISGLSIGYSVKKEAWVEGVRQLLKVRLWEISLVTFPMNELAGVGNVKATDIKTIRDFEAFLRDVGGFGNEQAKAIASSGFKAAGSLREEESLASLARSARVKIANILK